MDNPWYLLLVLSVGSMAGFINTVAGGGSLITLPILITVIGLPSNIANATNRVAIVVQNISAVKGFENKGISAYPYSLYLGIAAIPGAILGAELALDIRTELFNKMLAVVMVAIVLITIFQRNTERKELPEKLSVKDQLMGVIVFFFIGIYGGFLQAGVGYIIITVLTSLNNFSLVKTNSAKVFTVMVYTLAAVIIFAMKGKINWTYALSLAVGNAMGAWVASHWSVDKGDVWIRRFIAVTVIALAIKLWFF